MSELKACPFCGRLPNKCSVKLPFQGGKANIVQCECGAFLNSSRWNTRPIEDALRARAEAAEADNKRLREIVDELGRKVADLEAETRWIPVSERLPEKSYADLGDEKLVELDYPYDLVAAMKFHRDEFGEVHWFTGGYGSIQTEWTQHVIRWRELPQPPKPEEK